jgi:hypothetical protein
MEIVVAYLYSLAVYTCFQHLDILSTKLVLSKLDVEKHELNPLLVFLKKKVGIRAAFWVMWLLIANSIAAFDAFYIQTIFGFTLACFFVGMFHLFAAFNNLQIYFETQFVGADNVERNTSFLIQELKKRSRSGKIVLLLKLNSFNLFLSIFGVATLVLSTRLLETLQFRFSAPISVFLLYFPPMMILALILFTPYKVLGMLFICKRRLDKPAPISTADSDLQEHQAHTLVSLPVDILEAALKKAKANNAKHVQFSLVPDEHEASK